MNDIPEIHRLYLKEMGLEKKSDVSTQTWNILNVIDTILNEKIMEIEKGKLKELLSKCKASVSINVNQHRDHYRSVEEHIEERALMDEELIDEIGKDVYEEMKKTNTIVEIQAYPDTPIGSYRLFHYDIDKAIDIMLSCVNDG